MATNPSNLTPEQRLDAMVQVEQPYHTYHDYQRALRAVALDLLSRLYAAEARVKTLTAENAALLIKIRDVLIQLDPKEARDEAYHVVYMFAASIAANHYEPWVELEARAADVAEEPK